MKYISLLKTILSLIKSQGFFGWLKLEKSIRRKDKIIQYKYKDDFLHINYENELKSTIINGARGLYEYLNKIAEVIGKDEIRVVFDVGANCGLFSFFIKKKYPKAKVYIFEPSPGLIDVIKLNLKSFDNFEIIPKVVSNSSNQKVIFYVNPSDEQTNSMNIDSVQPYCTNGMQKLELESITLDDFCNERGIDKIDILKVDIQGSEYQLLKGAQNILGKIPYSVFEFSFFDFNSNSQNIMQTLTALNCIYKKRLVLGPVVMGADVLFHSNTNKN